MSQPQSGDLLVVRTPRTQYRLIRRLMRSTHDHVAVVIGGGQTLNVIHPRAVRVPLARLLRPGLSPVLLRPSWPSQEAREGFVALLERLEDVPYDAVRATVMVLQVAFGVRRPLRPASLQGPSYVCTDTTLLGLSRALPELAEALGTLPLDFGALQCATINDFFRIASLRPDLLRHEPLELAVTAGSPTGSPA